jgi:hypothetical protein
VCLALDPRHASPNRSLSGSGPMRDGWESLALSSVLLSGSKRVGRNGGVEVGESLLGQQLGKRAEQGTKTQERLACRYKLSQRPIVSHA